MSITEERLAEIEAFVDTDISDCPELTDEQLAQLKPSHYRKQAGGKEQISMTWDEQARLKRGMADPVAQEEAVRVPAIA
jgi:hypothetical protein